MISDEFSQTKISLALACVGSFFSSFSVITRVRMFGATSPRVHPHKHEEMFAARTRAKQCFNENVRNGGWRAFHGNLCV